MSNTPSSSIQEKITYPGKNKIFFNGRIITSPNIWWFLLTMGLLCGPLIYLSLVIFPGALKLNMHLWLIPYGIFSILIPYFCFKTAFTDPGILLRKTNPLSTIKADNPDEYDESGQVISRLLFHHLNDNFVIGKQVMIDGEMITLKYCHTCELFRPPKASHCHYCDNCVEEFDHHCPWLSNCIGRRNYRSFVLFVFSAATISIYNCIFMVVLFHKSGSEISIDQLGILFPYFFSANNLFFLFTLATGLTLSALFCYHLMLISYDLTTAQHVKKSKSKKFNWPVCRSNFYRVFFHPVPEVKIPWNLYTHRTKCNKEEFV